MGPCFRRDDGGEGGNDNVELQIPHRIQGSADRAVQARGDVVPARDRESAGARSDVRRRTSGSGAGQGAAARAGAQNDKARCGDRARPCRFDRAETRLSRSKGASQADAGQSAGARRVRGGRAGPRRGDRLAADGGRCEKSHRDARRSFPSRQVRRDHRPRRCAAVGCAGDAGARAPDRAWRRRRRRRRWSISGARCWKTRSARGSISSSRVTEDQAKFGDLVHDLLSALDLGDDRNADADDDENNDENQDGENDQSGAEGSPDSDAAQEMSADQAQASTDEMSESAMESAQASTSATPSTTANSATTRRRARRRGRIRAAPTSRAGRNITPSRRNSTR